MTTLYKKIGRRYHPIQDTEACDGLTNGDWVVVVRDGFTSCRKSIDPARTLEQIAATVRLEDIIVASLAKHSEGKPNFRKSTPKERRAWEAYCKVMGEEAFATITCPSRYDIASGIAKDLIRLVFPETKQDAPHQKAQTRHP